MLVVINCIINDEGREDLLLQVGLIIVFALESFHTFVSLVSEFPSLKEKSQFVFVPGPRDPGAGPILPR